MRESRPVYVPESMHEFGFCYDDSTPKWWQHHAGDLWYENLFRII